MKDFNERDKNKAFTRISIRGSATTTFYTVFP